MEGKYILKILKVSDEPKQGEFKRDRYFLRFKVYKVLDKIRVIETVTYCRDNKRQTEYIGVDKYLAVNYHSGKIAQIEPNDIVDVYNKEEDIMIPNTVCECYTPDPITCKWDNDSSWEACKKCSKTIGSQKKS